MSGSSLARRRDIYEIAGRFTAADRKRPGALAFGSQTSTSADSPKLSPSTQSDH